MWEFILKLLLIAAFVAVVLPLAAFWICKLGVFGGLSGRYHFNRYLRDLKKRERQNGDKEPQERAP